jgi:CheY-like chemotaxis protein
MPHEQLGMRKSQAGKCPVTGYDARKKKTVNWNGCEGGLIASMGRHMTPSRRVIDGRRNLAAKHIASTTHFFGLRYGCCVASLNNPDVLMPTILLVDNEPEVLVALGMILELRGYRVLLSADGQAALRQAGRRMPDLIVTDCNMPMMDGVELCRHLKLYPALGSIPVIMVSAHAQAQRDPALWNAFFLKPIDLEGFESTVGLLVLSRPSREMLRPVCLNRARSRWQPMSSAVIP